MTNERKTETITRELLAELHYYDSESITVEEQSSDFKNIKKMRDVRTIILAAVSRRDLCYVPENKGFRF